MHAYSIRNILAARLRNVPVFCSVMALQVHFACLMFTVRLFVCKRVRHLERIVIACRNKKLRYRWENRASTSYIFRFIIIEYIVTFAIISIVSFGWICEWQYSPTSTPLWRFRWLSSTKFVAARTDRCRHHCGRLIALPTLHRVDLSANEHVHMFRGFDVPAHLLSTSATCCGSVVCNLLSAGLHYFDLLWICGTACCYSELHATVSKSCSKLHNLSYDKYTARRSNGVRHWVAVRDKLTTSRSSGMRT